MSIPVLFAAQVARTPEAVALTCEGRSMTYRELDEAANRLAHLLAGQGAGPGMCGAAVSPVREAVVAMLAVLKTGAAYVPIDPALPAARIGFMVADAAPIVAITTTGLRRGWTGATCWSSMSTTPHRQLPGDGLAGAGSRGYRLPDLHLGHHRCPQGRGLTHHNVTHLLESLDAGLPSGPGQVWTQWHSLAFDVSVWEIFGALLRGGRLVVVPESVAGSPDDFHALLVTEHVSVLSQTPSAVAALSPEGLDWVALVVGGEACPGEVVDRWAPGRVMINGYGPTETTCMWR